MCYGLGCYYEDSQGECRRPRREPCPNKEPESSWRDNLCDELYEQAQDALREKE